MGQWGCKCKPWRKDAEEVLSGIVLSHWRYLTYMVKNNDCVNKEEDCRPHPTGSTWAGLSLVLHGGAGGSELCAGGAAEMPPCLLSHPEQVHSGPRLHLLRAKKLWVTMFSDVKFTLTLFNSLNSMTWPLRAWLCRSSTDSFTHARAVLLTWVGCQYKHVLFRVWGAEPFFLKYIALLLSGAPTQLLNVWFFDKGCHWMGFLSLSQN